jgi:uncharacterized protein YxeA
MKLKSIFVDDKTGEGLYAILYETEVKDEFERLLDLWNNTKYVKDYFVQNRKYLETEYFSYLSIDAAITKVLEEADELENLLYKYTEDGFQVKGENLQMLFRSLSLEKKESKIPKLQYTKAKIDLRKFPKFLRFYAVRIDKNTFIITGGAIKLTKYMSEHNDTIRELEKLDEVKGFLGINEITTLDDLNYYYEQS